MVIRYLPKFKKQYKKLPPKIRQRFSERVELLVENRTDPQLRLHPLKGSYQGYWSIDITGDIRALFIQRGDEIIIFALIGTHSQLYG